MENVKINGKSYLFAEDYFPNVAYAGMLFLGSKPVGVSELTALNGICPDSEYQLFSLDHFFVESDFRLDGLGSFLLEKVKDFARREERSIRAFISPRCGLKALTLEQLTDFYKRHGFEVKGREAYWSPE